MNWMPLQDCFEQHFVEPSSDIDIDFYKVPRKYFKDRGYNVRISGIQPDQEGYITDSLSKKLDHDRSETVVVNVGVGQGKTYTAHKLVEHYADEGFIVLMVSPFKRLIDRDYLELSERFGGRYKIANYRQLESKRSGEEQWDLAICQIHCMSIHALLGYPGEDSVLQAAAKREYLKLIVHLTRKNDKKAVIIFDEIHEAVHVFKEQLIYYLRKWKDLVHRSYVLSATFNEASTVCVEYISAMTDYKLHLVSSSRGRDRQVEGRISRLHLLLLDSHYEQAKGTVPTLASEAFKTGKKVNILTAYKSTAEELHKSIKEKTKRAKLQTSDSGETFDESNLNVGTTFKTGVSIENSDQLFIVVAPTTSNNSSSRQGIFSDGIPSIVQALARPRNGGDVVVCLPLPDVLIEGDYIAGLKELTPDLLDTPTVQYVAQEGMRTEIDSLYHRLRSEIKDEISEAEEEYNSLEEGETRPHLEFPTFERFTLEQGQALLAKTNYSFGRDVAPYLIWAAFNDQFLSCHLASIWTHKHKSRPLDLSKDNLDAEISNFLDQVENLDFEAQDFYQQLEKVFQTPQINGETYRLNITIDGKSKSCSKLLKSKAALVSIMTWAYKHRGIDLIGERYSVEDHLLIHAALAKAKLTWPTTARETNTFIAYEHLAQAIKLFQRQVKEASPNHLWSTDAHGLISDEVLEYMKAFSEAAKEDRVLHVLSSSVTKDMNQVKAFKLLKGMLAITSEHKVKLERPDTGTRGNCFGFKRLRQLPKEGLNLVFRP